MRFLSIEPMLGPIAKLPLEGIHWVIVGGESGTGFREIKVEWVRSIRDQCAEAGVAFFLKQWAGLRPAKDHTALDGRMHRQFPEVTR